MLPILILTRPRLASDRFAAMVTAEMDGPVASIIAPMMDIRPVKAIFPNTAKGVIFTSENAVAQVDRLQIRRDIPAFVVGDQTESAARAAGFETQNAQGSARDLIKLIQRCGVSGPLVHLRGRETTGDIAATLCAAQIDCTDAICYDQVPLPASDALLQALKGERRLVLPLFSPRSATILAQAVILPQAQTHVVAMSEAVAAASMRLATERMTVAKHPDARSMVAATCAALKGELP